MERDPLHGPSFMGSVGRPSWRSLHPWPLFNFTKRANHSGGEFSCHSCQPPISGCPTWGSTWLQRWLRSRGGGGPPSLRCSCNLFQSSPRGGLRERAHPPGSRETELVRTTKRHQRSPLPPRIGPSAKPNPQSGTIPKSGRTWQRRCRQNGGQHDLATYRPTLFARPNKAGFRPVQPFAVSGRQSSGAGADSDEHRRQSIRRLRLRGRTGKRRNPRRHRTPMLSQVRRTRP